MRRFCAPYLQLVRSKEDPTYGSVYENKMRSLFIGVSSPIIIMKMMMNTMISILTKSKTMMTIMIRTIVVVVLAFVLVIGMPTTLAQQETDVEKICTSSTNTFTVRVDLFASQLGYFVFEECGLNNTNPTIGIVVGETYTFVQKDRSNWMHPMGFAYYPDGDHDGKDELEPTIVPPGSTNTDCAETYTCPTPKYHLDNEFLGVANTSDFGLDSYEPLFYRSIPEWTSMGNFSVDVTFTDPTVTAHDIFYFCHIHQYMSGRIKLLDPDTGDVLNPNDVPEIEYDYDSVSSYDAQCGTYGIDLFQVPNPSCPTTFVCPVVNGSTSGDASVDFDRYVDCYDSINCHMLSGMTTKFHTSNDPTVLFIHQMIPHHVNAVNMAKNLLHAILSNSNDSNTTTAYSYCDDLSNEDSTNCAVERLLRGMINSQNHQIQQMKDYLEGYNIPITSDCTVTIADTTIVTDKYE